MAKRLNLLSMPDGIHQVILEKVCNEGFEDLCRAKATCKTLKDVAGNVSFAKNVDIFIMQHPEPAPEGVTNFKNICLQHQNPSALFCFGTYQFFKQGKLDEGLELIRLSAEGGYELGIYAYAMLVRILNPQTQIDCGVAFVSRQTIRNARQKLDEIPEIEWPMFDWRPPEYEEKVQQLKPQDVYACGCCPTRKWPRAWFERSKAGRMCDKCFWLCQKLWFSKEFPKKVLSWPDQHHVMNSAVVVVNNGNWGQAVEGNNAGWGQAVEADNGGWGQAVEADNGGWEQAVEEDNEGGGGWGQE